MKNILLLIHKDAGQEARYQAALDIARAVNGHLICLDLTVIPNFVGDYIGSSGFFLAEDQQSEAQNKARMLVRLRIEDVPFEWIDRVAFMEQSIEDQAGLADLIILSTDAKGTLFPYMADVIGDLLVKLGKPILVVPAEAKGCNVHGRALVAWDGSDDAEAALRAATPLLQRSANVTLYHVDDGSLETPVEDAARYLSRYGVEPVITTEPKNIERPGTAILREVADGHHDYVVMGAYGRSRSLETIFGGVTRTMLERSPVPVLFVHRR